MISTSV